jgi:SAM-dependent methyltransferase
MDKNPLKGYYTQKYSSEDESESIDLINLVRIPVSRYEACVKFFPIYFKGGSILELGAGNGNIAKTLLASKLRIDHYTLTEISPPRISALRKNLVDSRTSIQEYDAENIPKSEYGKYDAVIMVALIEHLIDPLRAMQNIRLVLKPGGIVYIDTPNIAKYTRRIKLLFGRFPSTASKNEGLTTYSEKPADLYDEGHLHYFTYRSLSQMLSQRCGFVKITKLGYANNSNRLGKYFSHFLSRVYPELFSEIAIIAHA